jgi:cell wall-associated NlpC family hydrolase
VTNRVRLILLALVLLCTLALGIGRALAAPAVFQPEWRDFPRTQPTQTLGMNAVRYARHLLGVPYRYGGSSPSTGFDCSGFVRFVYDHFGVELPHSSYAQFNLGRRVPRGALKPGDLVFFDGVGHVGLYIGGGRFMHAPHTGTRVSIDSLAGWYSARYDGARRLVRSD